MAELFEPGGEDPLVVQTSEFCQHFGGCEFCPGITDAGESTTMTSPWDRTHPFSAPTGATARLQRTEALGQATVLTFAHVRPLSPTL